MESKKYLIWLDILGFEQLAREIAQQTGITERKVRHDFIDVVRRSVKALEAEGEIIGKSYGKRDDWILVTDSMDSAFKVVSRLLDHHTQYRNYEKIPLEIAIGVGHYDKWARFGGQELIIEDPTIDFLKTKIVGHYHEWYKLEHNNRSPLSTFIVLTKEVYRELEPLDRKICQEVEHKHREDDFEVFFVADIGKVEERERMFEFLEMVRRPNSRLYDRINDLYIAPVEYDEIKRVLEMKRIVFITGTPEYGKTYTAIRLLWEYFVRGYGVVWEEGGEESERSLIRKRLEEIEKELKPHRVIYFEDPFGKTRYERRESLRRDMGRIIDCVHNVQDVYVIITSREEIFKEFEKEHLSAVEIKDFEKKLNLKRPSYDSEGRKRILLAWAEAKGCKWLKDDVIANVILRLIEDGKNLPTPLSIRDFVISSRDLTERNALIEKIEEKSIETARSFAEEIENMTDDKILFLSFFFVFHPALRIHFAKEEYERFVKELDMKKSWDFWEILDWFKDDKIEAGREKMRFSHPSYFEALDHLLAKGGLPTRISRDIFSRILLRFSEVEENLAYIFWKEGTGCLLYETWYLERIFDKIPKNVQSQLLVNLSQRVTEGSNADMFLKSLAQKMKQYDQSER